MKFMTHEALANGIFNKEFNSAGPNMEAWKPYMTNSREILDLVVNRLEADYCATHTKMRRPFNAFQIDA